jgi:hypothetical protein
VKKRGYYALSGEFAKGRLQEEACVYLFSTAAAFGGQVDGTSGLVLS